MVWISFIWFLLLYSAGFLYARKDDIFSPVKFISIKFMLLNVSFILYTAIFPESFLRSILKICDVTLDQAFLKYTILQTIAYLCLVCGITVFRKKKILPVSGFKESYSYRNIKILAVALYSIGLSAYFIFLYRVGGLHYLLTHLEKRVQLQGGQYILNLMPLMSVACILFILAVKLKNKTADKLLLAFFAFGNLALLTSLGGRKSTLVFIVMFIVALHYIIKPLKFTRKTVIWFSLFAVLLSFYIVAVPFLRSPAAKSKNIAEAYPKVITLERLMYNVSYVFIDVFAANYFTIDNAWYFDGFLAPGDALFAKGDKGNIPQVDQGVYFNSIVRYQKDFRPPMPRNLVSDVSWPTENFGFGYANLLVPGIIIFFFLQGAVFSIGYRLLQYRYSNPVMVVIYVLLIFEFNFSSLNLAFFVKTLPLMYLCYIVFNKFVLSKKLLKALH